MSQGTLPSLSSGGLSGEGTYTQQDLDNLRRELGTDRNIVVQYADWGWGVLRGDLGNSLFRNVPVTDDLKFRIPLTLELAVMASVISFLLAVPLGVISALKPDSIFDYAARIFTFAGISIPIFVSGILVVYVLVNVFKWFPPIGYAHLWEEPSRNLQQMIFPALTLAFYQMNFIARVTRSAMLEVMREDYIRTARSKGLRESSVVLLHALKNAFLPCHNSVRMGVWPAARRDRNHRENIRRARNGHPSGGQHPSQGLHSDSGDGSDLYSGSHAGKSHR